jgi:Bacterial transcriptional activator domain
VGQLMLALCRSGRQAEALLAFDRARRTLAEELGVDPGAPLKQLHQQIVQQDPSLEIRTESAAPAAVATPTSRPPAPSTGHSGAPPSAPASASSPILAEKPSPPPRTRGQDRALPRPSVPRRRALIVGAMTLAVLLGAVFIPRIVGGGGGATIASGPGTALIDLKSGKVIASIPLSQLAVAAYPVFADGHFWVNNFSPNSYVEIEPKTGRILRQVNPPARPVEVLGVRNPHTVRRAGEHPLGRLGPRPGEGGRPSGPSR